MDPCKALYYITAIHMCFFKTIQEPLLENAFDSHASTYLLLRNNTDFTIATDIALQEMSSNCIA